MQLLPQYNPVPIPIVHSERPPQVVEPVAITGAVDGDELIETDEAVDVGVGLAHHGGSVVGGAAEAEENAVELGESASNLSKTRPTSSWWSPRRRRKEGEGGNWGSELWLLANRVAMLILLTEFVFGWFVVIIITWNLGNCVTP